MTVVPAHGGPPEQTGKLRILVVEDNYLTASTVCDMVEACGYTVAAAVGRVESGLDFLTKVPVDGALVDVNLGGTMSFPLCAELRRRQVPFTFLTGYPLSVIPDAFRDAPVLAKPIDQEQIRSALGSLAALESPTSVPTVQNLILQRLAAEDRRLLHPKLEKVALTAGDALELPGQTASHIVFPESGAVSIGITAPGHRLEVALVGREGLVGVGALLGAYAPRTHSMVLLDGGAFRVSSRELRSLMRESPRLRDRLLSYVDVLLTELCETTLATGRGSIEQRLARWLLMASDRLESDEVPLTHDSIAAALGVRRSGVTIALHELEGRQVIRSKRGRVVILSRAGLVEEAGGFYCQARQKE